MAAREAGVAEVGHDVLEEVDGDLLGLGDPLALDRPLAGRRELDHRPDRVVRFRRDAHRASLPEPLAATEVVDQDPDPADLPEPEPRQDRARLTARLGDRDRCTPRRSVPQAGVDERPVDAAPTRLGQGRRRRRA